MVVILHCTGTNMSLGPLVKRYREQTGIGAPDLLQELSRRGFEIKQSTYYDWEKKSDSIDWNPEFVTALADIFGKTEIEILDELGFNIVPEGFTKEDVEFAQVIRSIPNPLKRRRVLQALIGIIDLLDSE